MTRETETETETTPKKDKLFLEAMGDICW